MEKLPAVHDVVAAQLRECALFDLRLGKKTGQQHAMVSDGFVQF
jgi:hypothetical protein